VERFDQSEEGPVMQQDVGGSRRALEARLLERAREDTAFRRALIGDPKGTLERELGVTVPARVGLTVLEETPTARYLVLPPAPMRENSELSDKELEAVAGGDPCGEISQYYLCTVGW
jgi:hypothetical protein